MQDRKFTDDYSLLKTITLTNQGQVARGVIKATQEPVAIKISNRGPRTLEDPAEEVRLLKFLQDDFKGHPNIVHLVCSFQDKAHFISIFELHSSDLFSLVQERESQGNPLPISAVAYFFCNIVRGVEFLHSHNIAHLDLCLENTLVARTASRYRSEQKSPGAVICDLGQAVRIPYSAYTFSNPTNFRRGRQQYMAPEVFSGTPFNGLQADMFSLGVLLFILLTGVPPFYKPTATDASYKILMRGRSGLDKLLRGWNLLERVPPIARELLMHLLCPPAERYSAQEVLRHPFLAPHSYIQDRSISSCAQALRNMEISSPARVLAKS
jgi:serine/threonine protein kinase